jgi:hypothetical protein
MVPVPREDNEQMRFHFPQTHFELLFLQFPDSAAEQRHAFCLKSRMAMCAVTETVNSIATDWLNA